jgi:hypothetical protein
MITSKQEFRNYIRSMLGGGSPGEGILNIEVSTEQFNNAIDKAVKESYRYLAGEGIYEDYFVFTLSAGVSAYDMSGSDVYGVIDFELGSTGTNSINHLFSPMNLLYGSAWSQMFTGGGGGGLALANYQSMLLYLETIKDFFTISYKLDFNELEQRLIVVPSPTENCAGILRLWRKETAINLYNNVLVQDLTIAIVKTIWGTTLRKNPMTLPDGSNTREFGKEIYEEGTQEKKDLIKKMNAGVEGEGDWIGFLIG